MLPELTDVSAAEAPIGAVLARAGGHEVREVFFDVGLDVGAGAFEIAKPIEFVRHELIVGGGLCKGRKVSRKVMAFAGHGVR